MTIEYRIMVCHEKDFPQNAVLAIIKNTFDEVNQIYNKWNPHSELSKLNQLRAGEKVYISEKLEKILLLTHKIVILSQGRFDPTIEPLQKLWKKKLEQGTIPTVQEIQAIAPSIGWNKIHIVDHQFFKDCDETRLDLGGIAKGYCVDLLVQRLNDAGYENIYVEWGGEIRTSGEHPDKRPWNVFISRLGSYDPQEAIAIVSLKNQALATSGDYLQSWSINNETEGCITYFHVIDPYTLQPCITSCQSVASASVLGPDCATADGLATAALMFPSLQEAQEWAKSMEELQPELTFWLISRELSKE